MGLCLVRNDFCVLLFTREEELLCSIFVVGVIKRTSLSMIWQGNGDTGGGYQNNTYGEETKAEDTLNNISVISLAEADGPPCKI